MKQELLNLSQIAYKYNLHRSTVRRRLEAAGIKPHSQTANRTVYKWTEETEDIVTEREIVELKKKKLRAEADLIEMKLRDKQSAMLPVADVRNALQAIVKNLEKELCRTVKRIAPKLFQIKEDSAEVQVLLEREYGEMFQKLRKDHTKFL